MRNIKASVIRSIGNDQMGYNEKNRLGGVNKKVILRKKKTFQKVIPTQRCHFLSCLFYS